jgi:hypothetical protein
MSVSGAWTAIRGKAAADVLRELGLHAITEELPAITGTELANGWYVITVGLRQAEDPCAPVLAKLSAGCEVIACGAVESTMYSEAAAWKDGVRIWSVACDPDQSMCELVIEGTPPAFDAASGLGSLFEVPFQLSKSITGFRPDEGSSEPFQALASNQPQIIYEAPKKSSWLKKLFGG